MAGKEWVMPTGKVWQEKRYTPFNDLSDEIRLKFSNPENGKTIPLTDKHINILQGISKGIPLMIVKSLESQTEEFYWQSNKQDKRRERNIPVSELEEAGLIKKNTKEDRFKLTSVSQKSLMILINSLCANVDETIPTPKFRLYRPV